MKSQVEKDEYEANLKKLKNTKLPLWERVLAHNAAFLVADDHERKVLFMELEIAAMEIRNAEADLQITKYVNKYGPNK